MEVLWNAQAFEDLALLNVGFAPVLENVDYHWEIFLWGDPPIKAQGDIDLVIILISLRTFLTPGLNTSVNGGMSKRFKKIK